MSTSSSCLIFIHTDSTGGTLRLSRLLAVLGEKQQIQKVSSVYKRYENKQRLETSAKIAVAALLTTMMDIRELSQHLEDVKLHGDEIYLLTYSDAVMMSPKVLVPNPLLHEDDLIINACVEIAPSFVHPVYNKELKQLVEIVSRKNYFEFVTQGESLLAL